MTTPRSIHILSDGDSALHDEAMRDSRRGRSPVRERKLPERPEAWQARRAAYLYETGRTEVVKP